MYFARTNHNILINQYHKSSEFVFILQASASIDKEGSHAELLDTQCKMCIKDVSMKEQRKEHFQIWKRQIKCQFCTQAFTTVKNFHAHIGICRVMEYTCASIV